MKSIFILWVWYLAITISYGIINTHSDKQRGLFTRHWVGTADVSPEIDPFAIAEYDNNTQVFYLNRREEVKGSNSWVSWGKYSTSIRFEHFTGYVNNGSMGITYSLDAGGVEGWETEHRFEAYNWLTTPFIPVLLYIEYNRPSK